MCQIKWTEHIDVYPNKRCPRQMATTFGLAMSQPTGCQYPFTQMSFLLASSMRQRFKCFHTVGKTYDIIGSDWAQNMFLGKTGTVTW